MNDSSLSLYSSLDIDKLFGCSEFNEILFAIADFVEIKFYDDILKGDSNRGLWRADKFGRDM